MGYNSFYFGHLGAVCASSSSESEASSDAIAYAVVPPHIFITHVLASAAIFLLKFKLVNSHTDVQVGYVGRSLPERFAA